MRLFAVASLLRMGASEDRLLEAWRAEERRQPEGWDFTDLEPRMSESAVPWDLAAVYRTALAGATRVLDMGTGGGEFLLRLADSLPRDTVATEGWEPNVEVARRILAPLGIKVVEYGAPDEDVDSVAMPFPDGRFDVVLNRHESFSPRELARVLAPGGQFVTQQVGGDEAQELRLWFGEHPELPHVNLGHLRRDLEQVGFTVVEADEHVGAYVFQDVTALVAYLQLVPWETPDDFSVDRYAERLLALHHETAGGPVRLTRKRFWMQAVRR
ncbi:class I SAM-dependent methyltransferase [Ornithinimicrobium cryptoxanthini]|uniref:class I SAM-dependent methyltransferase n=1 Tax=Ornithinimicrobium cryptoxanthini TaxID=2934161 RepID=UPI0021174829|nr:class I SAM-dependent methyltransferase [Ornithinimicrobium cryptoxanthini]